MPFDPSLPFTIEGQEEGFDPSQPFEFVSDEETGYAKGVVQSLGRGLAQIGISGGDYLQDNPEYMASGLTPGERDESKLSAVNRAGQSVSDYAKKLQDKIPEPNAGGSELKRSVFQGFESAPPSVAYAIPAIAAATAARGIGATTGAAMGATGGPVGSAIGAVAGGLASSTAAATAGQAATSRVMFASTRQQTLEELDRMQAKGLLRDGVTQEEKMAAADAAGHAEWQGEAPSSIVEALIYSRLPAGKVLSGILKPGIKQFGKNMAMSAPLEVGGEMFTSKEQTDASNSLLKPEYQSDSTQAMKDSIVPTLVMTGLMNAVGVGGQRVMNRKNVNALINGDMPIDERMAAVSDVAKELKASHGQAVSDAFQANASRHLADSSGMDLEDPSLLSQQPAPPKPSGPISRALSAADTQAINGLPGALDAANAEEFDRELMNGFADEQQGIAAQEGERGRRAAFGQMQDDALMGSMADTALNVQDQADTRMNRRDFEAQRRSSPDETLQTLAGMPETDLEKRLNRQDELEQTFGSVTPYQTPDDIQNLNLAAMAEQLPMNGEGVSNAAPETQAEWLVKPYDDRTSKEIISDNAPVSLNPDWYKADSIKEYNQRNGTNVSLGGQDNVRKIIKKHLAGEELTPAQSRVLDYLKEKAGQKGEHQTAGQFAERVNELEHKKGYVLGEEKEVPVEMLHEGDKVVGIDANGLPDELTHKGFTAGGKALLQDGVTVEASLFKDSVKVIGQKNGEGGTATETDSFNDDLMNGLADNAESAQDQDEAKATKREVKWVQDEVRRNDRMDAAQNGYDQYNPEPPTVTTLKNGMVKVAGEKAEIKAEAERNGLKPVMWNKDGWLFGKKDAEDVSGIFSKKEPTLSKTETVAPSTVSDEIKTTSNPATLAQVPAVQPDSEQSKQSEIKPTTPTLNDADKASTVENSVESDPIAKLHSTIDQTYNTQADRLKQTGRPVPSKEDLHAYADKEHSEGGQGGTVMDMINDLSDEMEKTADLPQNASAETVTPSSETASAASLPFSPENAVLLVADDIDSLRPQDIYRLLSAYPDNIKDIASYIKKNHRSNQRMLDTLKRDIEDIEEESTQSSPENVKKLPEKDTVNAESKVESEQLQTFMEKDLEGIKIPYKRIAKDGTILGELPTDASKVLKTIDDDLDIYKRLRDCMKGKG